MTGVLLVALVGLIVAGAATFLLQRSFLLDRVDEQLDDARLPARTALAAENDAAASTPAPGGSPVVPCRPVRTPRSATATARPGSVRRTR